MAEVVAFMGELTLTAATPAGPGTEIFLSSVHDSAGSIEVKA